MCLREQHTLELERDGPPTGSVMPSQGSKSLQTCQPGGSLTVQSLGLFSPSPLARPSGTLNFEAGSCIRDEVAWSVNQVLVEPLQIRIGLSSTTATNASLFVDNTSWQSSSIANLMASIYLPRHVRLWAPAPLAGKQGHRQAQKIRARKMTDKKYEEHRHP